jgi:putative NADH-flavin reductase
MNIFLLGATGGVGNSFLQQALANGHTITAMVRDVSKLSVQHPHLTAVPGNAFDISDIRKHMPTGCAVVSCLNTSRKLEPSDELERMIANVVTVMSEKGNTRIVYCASAGVEGEIPGEKGKEVMHLLRHPLQDHANAINLIKSHALQYTIARPGGLLNGELTGAYLEAPVGIPQGKNMINRADVAHFMLKALEDDAYINTSIGLTN